MREFIDVLYAAVNVFKCDLDSFASYARRMLAGAKGKQEHDEHAYALRFAKAAKSPSGPLQQVVADLVDFYASNGSTDKQLVIDDLVSA